MRNLKRLLFIILALTLALSLFACGGGKCTEHTDENGDGKCDKCKEEMPAGSAKVLLFEEGLPTFRFVVEKRLNKNVLSVIDDYVDAMSDIDLDIEVADDEADDSFDCEILVGDITSRGEKYTFDKHSLGKDGYVFKIVDNKIIINAGSYEMLEAAVEIFLEEVLMFDEDTEDYATLYMESKQEVLEVQNDYGITSLKVNGTDIKGTNIATLKTNATYRKAAESIQELLYDRVGIWLEIVSLEEAVEGSVIIRHAERTYGENSFHVYANDEKQLVIDCSFDNKLNDAVASFLTAYITLKDGDINFTGSVHKQDISFLTYEEFGAVGNGKTDDFKALYDTHVTANEYGQTVKAKQSATYYIKSSEIIESGVMKLVTIPIRTSTYWGKAKFTIDDRELDSKYGSANREQTNMHIFTVESDHNMYKIADESVLKAVLAGGLRPGATKLELTFDYPVMIIPYNETHTVYRRRGYGSAQGEKMHEVIVLDKNGNIDESTPIMFDYAKLNYINVYRLDIEPITIEGGIFTTRASRVSILTFNQDGTNTEAGGYIKRGLDVRRSFTTVKGVEHYVTDELTIDDQIDNGKIVKIGAPYYGFFVASNANEVTFENCVLTGRRCYKRPNDCTNGGGTTGTYDLTGGAVNKLIFKGCVQSNFWITIDENTTEISASTRGAAGSMPSMASYKHDGVSVKMHWGIGGTNFCKNMEYIDSTLSRFDAHSGLYNGKIINSTVNYMALTGNGTFIVDNVEWYSEGTGESGASMFHLRADYGSTWDGEIIAKDLKAYVYTTGDSYLFLHSYSNWYYGYVSAMPRLSLDNLDIYDIKTFEPVPAGRTIYMMQGSVKGEPNMHLSFTANKPAEYCYIDLDEDGLVDFTDIPYVKADASKYSTGLALDSSDPNYKKNLNKIAPPEYLKIINNDGVDGAGGYVFQVDNTQDKALAADPGVTLPEGVDPNGGFFATTKFYYGPGENDYYLGTNHTNTVTFKFQ